MGVCSFYCSHGFLVFVDLLLKDHFGVGGWAYMPESVTKIDWIWVQL